MSEVRVLFLEPRGGRVLFDFAFADLPKRFVRSYRAALRDPLGEQANSCIEPGSGNLLFELDVEDNNPESIAQWNLCFMFSERAHALRKGRYPFEKLQRITDSLDRNVLRRMEEICHAMTSRRRKNSDPALSDIYSAVEEGLARSEFAFERTSPTNDETYDLFS